MASWHCLRALAVPATLLILGLLCGLIPAAGLWRDSFATADLSPVRIYQFAATLVGAAAVLIAFARTGQFPSEIPDSLAILTGGSLATYLTSKGIQKATENAARNGANPAANH